MMEGGVGAEAAAEVEPMRKKPLRAYAYAYSYKRIRRVINFYRLTLLLSI